MDTADAVFDYIVNDFTNLERGTAESMRPYRLDRMRALLDYFGHPEKSFRSVHVAGSKGKGSTAEFIGRGLAQAGYRTGIYSSPHVSDFRERIRLLPGGMSDTLIIDSGTAIRSAVDGNLLPSLPGKERPTTFELLTLLAYLCFRASRCEWGVIEVGIGGRLDATNVLSPELCVIAPIELEHTEVLGKTLEAVATEKAGIIKPGIPVVSSAQRPAARSVIERTAAERGSTARFADRWFEEIRIERESTEGTTAALRFADRNTVRLTIRMPGRFQAENAALAYLALTTLSQSLGLPDRLIPGAPAAFADARIPGRMEIAMTAPALVIDGAHTGSSVARVTESFFALFPGDAVLVFGAVLGKDISAMASILAHRFGRIIITRPGTFKKSDPEAVYREFSALNPNTTLVVEPPDALRAALELSGGRLPILSCGSFYLIGEIRRAVSELAAGTEAPVRPANGQPGAAVDQRRPM